MTFVLFRNKTTNKIEKYNVVKTEKEQLKENISQFNVDSKEFNAEVVKDEDFIKLIEIAEENKKTKRSHLKDIEDSIERLRDDFYDLTRDLK